MARLSPEQSHAMGARHDSGEERSERAQREKETAALLHLFWPLEWPDARFARHAGDSLRMLSNGRRSALRYDKALHYVAFPPCTRFDAAFFAAVALLFRLRQEWTPRAFCRRFVHAAQLAQLRELPVEQHDAWYAEAARAYRLVLFVDTRGDTSAMNRIVAALLDRSSGGGAGACELALFMFRDDARLVHSQ